MCLLYVIRAWECVSVMSIVEMRHMESFVHLLLSPSKLFPKFFSSRELATSCHSICSW